MVNFNIQFGKIRSFSRILCLILCCIFNSIHANAQDSIKITGKLNNNAKYPKIVVRRFNIGTIDIVAVAIKNDGSFSITAPAAIDAGIYRLQYSQANADEYVDVIIDGKEKQINFTLDLAKAVQERVPVFTQSNENKNWYQYQTKSLNTLQKMVALEQLIVSYPDQKDIIVKQAEAAYALQKKNYQTQEATFLKQNQNTWAGVMVKNNRYYFTNIKQDWRLQEYEKRNHFWDNIETTNPKYINSPLYTSHILSYLKYYMNPEMKFSETEMEEGFKKSVDTIMQKFSGNEKTKKFALQYLQLGFKEIGQEKVLQYIDQKYKEVVAQCQDDSQKAEFDKRMAGYAAMKEGNQAPDIALSNDNTLYKIESEKTMVVFWASWCPHCMEELPKLNEWAKTNISTKVLAISLDDDKTAFETAIKNFPNLLHHTDFKKWDCKPVKDYYICGTPTFIVLDKDKKIVGKYSSFKQLVEEK